MNEAERCDRISLIDSGRVLATGKPAELTRPRGAATLEEAFIGYLETAFEITHASTIQEFAKPRALPDQVRSTKPDHPVFSLRRLLAYATARPLSYRATRSGSGSACLERRF